MEEEIPKPVRLQDIDFYFYRKHYANLLWRCKWYFLLITPVVALFLLGCLHVYRSKPPVLKAKVILGFDNPASLSAVQDIGITSVGKLELLKSPGVLKAVIADLSLRLQLHLYQRAALFDSVQVDSSVVNGTYTFEWKRRFPDAYAITFTNRKLGVRDSVLQRGRLKSLKTFEQQGIHLDFNPSFIREPHRFSFSIVSVQQAMEDISARLTLEQKTQSAGFASAILSGTDYRLIAATINSMADVFIHGNLGFRQRKTDETLSLLEKQLQTASAQLAASDQNLRAFRNANPTVGLTQVLERTLEERTQLERRLAELKEVSAQGNAIKERYARAGNQDRILIAQEIVAVLVRQNVASAVAMQGELANQIQQARTLQSTYSSSHPLVKKSDEALAKLIENLELQLENLLSKSNMESIEGLQRMHTLTSQMATMPQKALQLMELERRQQINAQINSQVMNRYNQTKILETATQPDVFVMDYADPPESTRPMKRLLMFLIIALAGVLVIYLAPVLLYDLLDKTVRTEKMLRIRMGLPVLETIPLIPVRKGGTRNNDLDPSPAGNEKLPVLESTPTYVGEIFRSLRTKILLNLQNTSKRELVVTSLNPNEGKSLVSANIAITMAQRQIKTVLIDGDMRNGRLHESFRLKQKPGLSDLLESEAELTGALVSSHLQANVKNLLFLPCGRHLPNPLELLGSPRFAQLIKLLSAQAGFLIMDTPPMGLVSDAVVAERTLSNLIIVVKAGATNIDDLKQRIGEFRGLHEEVVGLVLNGGILEKKMTYYKTYSKYYKNPEQV